MHILQVRTTNKLTEILVFGHFKLGLMHDLNPFAVYIKRETINFIYLNKSPNYNHVDRGFLKLI